MLWCLLTWAVCRYGLLRTMTASVWRVMDGASVEEEEDVGLGILEQTAHASPLQSARILSRVAKNPSAHIEHQTGGHMSRTLPSTPVYHDQHSCGRRSR